MQEAPFTSHIQRLPGLPRISQSRRRFVERMHLFALLRGVGFVVEADYGDFDRTPSPRHRPKF
ncbi:hypothetical protein [Sphingopyxis sp. MWB1]|uniref:hypothetical protein n=1 Tax=Sphingopyxis sp. MWB1 TaxID=1537715 RepID=UPI000519F7B4|nr:hypothetical protein [Sphingopyxis sp. MWB1]